MVLVSSRLTLRVIKLAAGPLGYRVEGGAWDRHYIRVPNYTGGAIAQYDSCDQRLEIYPIRTQLRMIHVTVFLQSLSVWMARDRFYRLVRGGRKKD